jgi:hypothetical protein
MARKKIIQQVLLVGLLVVVLSVHFKGAMPGHPLGFGSTLLGRWQLVAGAMPWMIFILYWEAASKNSAVSKSSETSVSRGMHLALINAALLLEFIQFPYLGRFLSACLQSIAAGFAVSATGLFVAIWARRT